MWPNAPFIDMKTRMNIATGAISPVKLAKGLLIFNALSVKHNIMCIKANVSMSVQVLHILLNHLSEDVRIVLGVVPNVIPRNNVHNALEDSILSMVIARIPAHLEHSIISNKNNVVAAKWITVNLVHRTHAIFAVKVIICIMVNV